MKLRTLRSVGAAFAATAVFLPGLHAQFLEDEVLVEAGSTWEYLLYTDDTNIPSDPTGPDADFYETWYLAAGYDGPTFLSGPAPLGYDVVTGDPAVTDIWGARDGATQPPSGSRYSAYFRTTFTPTSNVTDLRLSSIVDDGAIVYIDGVEITRTANFDAGAVDVWDLWANGIGSETAVVTGDFSISLPAGVEVTIAVSLHQANGTSSDMGMNFRVASLIPPDPTPPANDNFGDARIVDMTALPETLNNFEQRTHDGGPARELGASLEAGEPMHAGVANVGSVWYSIQPLDDGPLVVSAGGSSFSELIAVYTGGNLGTLTLIGSATEDTLFYDGATVVFEAEVGETYYVAVDGADNGGAPVLDENYGDVELTVSEGSTSLFTEIATLLPAGSDWEYLLAAEDDAVDMLLTNQPVDPALLGAGDADFHQTWHTAASYNGPAFSGPAPALLGYGVIDADPIITDIWGARDIDDDPATEDLVPPTGLRYAAYFRTTFTPTSAVEHLGFRGLIDDGAVIYINGVRVSNINFAGDPTDWQAFTVGTGPEFAPQEGLGLGVDLPANMPVEIAVSVRNPNATSSDMGFDLEVYSIEAPTLDYGKDLAANDPLRVSFEAADPFDTSGAGDGGINDNLSWVTTAADVQDETGLPDVPAEPGNAIFVNSGAITFVTGNIDVRSAVNSLVSVSVDLRSFQDSTSGFEANDNFNVVIEGSTDGIVFIPISTMVMIIGDGDGVTNNGELDMLQDLVNPGTYTTFTSVPAAIAGSISSIRVRVDAINNSGSERFYLDNVVVGTDIGPPPPLVATIEHNAATGENTIRWNGEAVDANLNQEGLYELKYNGDLTTGTNEWEFLAADAGLFEFKHTPPVEDGQGYYRVERFED